MAARPLTCALLATGACLIPAAPAASSAPATPLGFAIEAVGQPSYFVFDAKPRELIHGVVRVRSTSDRDRTIVLRAADAKTASTGGLDYGALGSEPKGTGSWIHL